MDELFIKRIVEALLMHSNEAISLEKLQTAFEDWEKPSLQQLQTALIQLSTEYHDSAVELKHVAHGYRFQTRVEYSRWINRLSIEKPAKYSRALLETLAIIAYRQPVTRADIEDVRGVSLSSSILKTLVEREWVKVAGHRDVPGKPAVYVTTKNFLAYFNLQSINDLPSLVEIPKPLTEFAAVALNQECIEE